ncbi:MAG: hypothetical protein C0412_17830, partial [Flavobacterium sp.]|nr:hypothetical protein [Flavobacterium sp.]
YNSKFFWGIAGGGTAEKRNSSYLEYCYATIGCHYCFGCVGLKNKEYYILNKQYSQESFDKLRTKIIEHMNEMPYISKHQITNPKSQINSNDQNSKPREIIYKYGEFFPPELSPFGYNETAAQDYYPLTREEVLEKGYSWSDYESEIKYQFSDYQVPDDISDVKDNILEKILRCEISGKPYKIIPMELEFYRKIGLPIPRKSPLQRHRERLAQLSPRKLYQRKCQKCQKEIETVYALDRPEVVYCERCYLQEVV